MFQMLNCLFQKLFNTWVRKRDSSLKSFPSLDLKKTRKKGRSWKSVLTRYSEILSFNLIKFAHLTNVIFLKFYLLLKQNKGCLIWKVRIRDKDALMMLHDQLLSKKSFRKSSYVFPDNCCLCHALEKQVGSVNSSKVSWKRNTLRRFLNSATSLIL